MAATIIKLFMLLGVALLASVCVSSTSDHENLFIFKSNRFQSLYENENGRIRLLQRFDKRSKIFENLQNYRKAILTVLNSNDRNSFNLEGGDTIKLPAGTIAYLVNRDDNEDLRVLDLAIPTNYEEIEEVLLEEQEEDPQHRRILTDRRQEINKEDVIVKISKEQIEELGRNEKTSSKKSVSSKYEPFNLRSRNPIYSNKFGKFFEITPEKNPQLQDFNIFVNSVEIKEGSLLLPNYNSRAIVIVTFNEGKGDIELVGQRNENQQEKREENDKEEEQKEEEISKQVQRYRARLSPGNVFVIPAGHPYAINASSELNLIGFGINAENKQRNFLAGEEDNVISQIQRPVKETVFPESSKEIDRLLKNQKESYFANAQPLQRE
ncbi:hypothetical protein RYX36_032183 [Vicia faba]